MTKCLLCAGLIKETLHERAIGGSVTELQGHPSGTHPDSLCMVGGIMAPRRCPCPGPRNLKYEKTWLGGRNQENRGKRDFADLMKVEDSGEGEMILDYSGGPNLITREMHQRDSTWEGHDLLLLAWKIEKGGSEPRNAMASRSREWPSAYSQQENHDLGPTTTGTEFCQQLKKAGRTDSPLKTPKEMQPNDALILS